MTIDAIPFAELGVGKFPAEDAKLVRAAVRVGDLVYTGWRHAEIMAHLRRNRLADHIDQDMQGFIDNHGLFYGRWRAARVAYRARQIASIPQVLTSEDLWDCDGQPIPPAPERGQR